MENIKVSVIIPVYNTEKYLDEAINSIISQTLQEIEIIIINDGSTDNSAQILERFAQQDSRIKIITLEENKGQSVARNTGMKIMKGEFIYFFDSDDILESDCLELCYQKMTKKDYDFLIFDRTPFLTEDNDDEQKLKLTIPKRQTDFLSKDFYNGKEILTLLLKKKAYTCSVCLCFIRKSYLDKLNLTFLTGVILEDELFSIQLYLSANKITFINRDFFHRRVRYGSTMNGTVLNKMLYSALLICNEIIGLKKTYKDKQSKKLLNIKVRDMQYYLIKTLIRSQNFALLLKNSFAITKILFKTLN
jgi:glycosyltransferase involved in cell wall biosynthesis